MPPRLHISLSICLILTGFVLLASPPDSRAQQRKDLVLVPPPPPAAVAPGKIIDPNTVPGNQYIPPISQEDPFTSSLALNKGMKIIFQIKSGLDTRWQHVGDYIFEADIEFNDHRGYAFDWRMSPPANASGSRAVDAEDVRNAHKVSLFYPDKESATLIGYTSIVRVSDYIYSKLKNGQSADFHLDGPDSPLVLKKHTRPVPTAIHPDGVEMVTISVNGTPRQVQTIKATTDTNWTYWILDNPNFPLMVMGNAPFQWKSATIATDLTSSDGQNQNKNNTGSGGNDQARKEAGKVIDQLEKSGKAISHLILFDFDSDRLRPLSKDILIELSQYLKKNQTVRLRVEGHTCNLGSKNYNLDLSDRRARSVKRFLVDHCGISADRLIPVGYGYSRPMASNKDESGRKKNRRVVFTRLDQAQRD